MIARLLNVLFTGGLYVSGAVGRDDGREVIAIADLASAHVVRNKVRDHGGTPQGKNFSPY